jgi:CheY-like chemotaxis protein
MTEQSEITLRTQSFNLGVMFSGSKMVLSEILESSGKNNRIELVFNPDQTLLPYFINSDLNKINQVMGNLFKNAVKFTSDGKIEFGMLSDKPGWLTFYLSDTGVGIPKNKQAIIFDPFRQVDDSNTRTYGGIGIGLAISEKITRVLDGSLCVVSEPGKGSTFYFSIPAQLSLPNDVIPINAVTKLQLNGKKIMIAEDDAMNLYILKMLFANSGAQIIEAINGKEAIEKYTPNIDLVLMDLKMPIIDGFAATRFIKSKSPQMPVIAVTSFAQDADKSRAREAGCSGVVSKPVDRELLFAEIGRNMNKPEALKALV